ncbi:MAG: hypothetical protein ACOCV7_01865, partial [Desulfonatronovibrionaceae bacterium]
AANAGIIAEKLRQAGIDAQMVGTRPVQRPALLEKSEYTEGLVYTYPSYNLDHPFLKDFEETYGQQPGFFAVEAYEALNTLIQALDQGNEKQKQLFDWYAGNVFLGALGRVKFRDNGDATYPYLYKTVADGRFKVAEFQFPMLLQKVKQELDLVFNRMDASLAEASEKLSAAGLTGPEADNILQQLFEDNPHAYNCVTVDQDGIIVNAAPEQYEHVVGQDISSQEQIIRLQDTRRPVLSQAIPMVEGFVSIDLEHPVFTPDRKFTGSVSILARPDFFGSIIDPRVYNFPVEIFVLQKDGTIIYDINEEEMGKNAFEDPMYADFPSVAETARSMVREKIGQGRYRFRDRYLKETVEKNIIWTTVGLHGTEYRLALTWSGAEADTDYQ